MRIKSDFNFLMFVSLILDISLKIKNGSDKFRNGSKFVSPEGFGYFGCEGIYYRDDKSGVKMEQRFGMASRVNGCTVLLLVLPGHQHSNWARLYYGHKKVDGA